jgi:hypothetical protein
VLSVLLRFSDSDYPFGIFKLFLHNKSSIHTRYQKRIANDQTSYPDKSQDQSNNKNADIQFSVTDAFLEQLSSGTLKVKRLKS